MKNMNCVSTMPEIMPEVTDEAIIEALFAQRPYEEKVINSAFLEIPAEYQRKLNIPNVEKMSAEFTELIANPPKVSYRDGHYFVFDGQHTIVTRRAMNGGQDLPIICKVYEGLTEEEEAMLFSRQTGVSTPLTAGAELRAALVGKDPESLAFVKATESTGLQLGLDSYRAPWKIICIRTAFKEYKTYGADLYKEALTMLAKGWEGDPDSLRSGILQGMVRFVALYQGEYDPERLVKRLHTVHPMTLVNDEKSLSGTVSYKYMMLINNLDETSFVYVKGNFDPIVSEALWHECERIRKSRISSLRLPDGETRRKGARTTKNLWVSKLHCRCGSSYRIFNWRKLKDGTPVFGYQCNMRTVNPTRSFVLEHNMTQQLSCDAISIPEWKLELMAKKIFEKVWGNQNKAILRACKMIESCQNGKATARMSAAPIQSKIEKIKKRKLNYAAMRADGELPREEYQALCKQADDEVARLEQELKALSPAPEPQTVSSDMKAIYDFLSQKVDVHGACLAPELIEQFVEVVTPIADYSYRWKLNTGCKKSKEERTDLMAVSEKPILTFTIDFETAKRYREANKMPHQFRRAAWTDLTVEVYL